MQVGAPFNPYKVFQGVFAPYWVLEHKGISTGAKLCYIRLLGFAGRDARCYPSLDTLGTSLGVSGRQARDYVKELVQARLIAVEQRGLRRTNVYLFLWSAELEQLTNSVPSRPDDPDDPGTGPPPERNDPSGPDRNSSSALDRNTTAVLDRNSSSALDRNTIAVLDRNSGSGPMGMNSAGKNSFESSSSSTASCREPVTAKTEERSTHEDSIGVEVAPEPEVQNRVAQTIQAWAKERRIQRLRQDRRLGLPENELITQWAAILASHSIAESDQITAVLDAAFHSAKRAGVWRSWAYLTLQIQLAAERLHVTVPNAKSVAPQKWAEENPDCEWVAAKAIIRNNILETAFMNWFAPTRQLDRRGSALTIAVPDEPTRIFLTSEYDQVTKLAASRLGIDEVQFIVPDATA